MLLCNPLSPLLTHHVRLPSSVPLWFLPPFLQWLLKALAPQLTHATCITYPLFRFCLPLSSFPFCSLSLLEWPKRFLYTCFWRSSFYFLWNNITIETRSSTKPQAPNHRPPPDSLYNCISRSISVLLFRTDRAFKRTHEETRVSYSLLSRRFCSRLPYQ